MEASYVLAELGCPPDEPTLDAAATLIWNTQRADGRFAPVRKAAYSPAIRSMRQRRCVTWASRLIRDWKNLHDHLLEAQYVDGGWRCNKFFYGRGPETGFEPGPTLTALDAFLYAICQYTPRHRRHIPAPALGNPMRRSARAIAA
ncbi:MAG: hypothetical protein R2912_03855 [Eubacteriales bacterium]